MIELQMVAKRKLKPEQGLGSGSTHIREVNPALICLQNPVWTCRKESHCVLYRLWGSHSLLLLGGGRKPPPSRRLPEHPQASSSPEQPPSPGPDVPLKELESELRMMVTQGGRGGHLHWPVARTAAQKEAEQPQLPVCVSL